MSRVTSAPLVEGMAFDSGSEALHAVQDYALSTGKGVRIERASGSDRRIVCSSKDPCNFVVQVYRQRHNDRTFGKWYIASLQLTHSPRCSSQLKVTTRQIADLPAFAEAVRQNPKANADGLIALVQQRYGLHLAQQKRLVYRARDVVKQGNALNRGNILESENSPLPPREFIRRRRWEKKEAPKKLPERMSWLDEFVETLLAERVHKCGKQFEETDQPSSKRELWEEIRETFNAKHKIQLTVGQLRVKFRQLQDQYTRIRAQEEELAQHPDKVVVYPKGWEMLDRYFGGSAGQTLEVKDHDDASLDEDNQDEEESQDEEADQDADLSTAEDEPHVIHTEQPVQEKNVDEVPTKRRRLDFPSDVQVQPPASAPNGVVNLNNVQSGAAVAFDVHERLDSIQNMQQEMVRSMIGVQQAVQQSTEAIRGLQHALDQSNQVNAALLSFLQRAPEA